MHVIEANNIRDALPLAVDYLLRYGALEQSRNGEVIAASNPVTIMYRNPKQHVLLNPVRDANPFFHLMEAMWMLAGRQDGSFLDNYIKGFSERYGNNGIIMDAYGFRWRHGLRFDQLDQIIAELRKDPTTRQCVLQMWGAGEQRELLSFSAKPCNLVATFRVLAGRLEMSVFNRSNDVIWGCCGANAVHFPILQEYMASRLDIEIGNYWQITTNLHLYTAHLDMMKERITFPEAGEMIAPYLMTGTGSYEQTQPLITYRRTFDEDLASTMIWLDGIHEDKECYTGNLTNVFLRDVVIPMATAYRCYRKKNNEGAYEAMEAVTAEDWHNAGKQWLDRRNNK